MALKSGFYVVSCENNVLFNYYARLSAKRMTLFI